MYEEPRLERYGTFREVTASGGADVDDAFTTDTNDACDFFGPENSQVICDAP